MFEFPSWRNKVNLSDISHGIILSALIWIGYFCHYLQHVWHGCFCAPAKKTCLFNPEETLALAFDGVRRVGDHNFNSTWVEDEERGETMHSWNIHPGRFSHGTLRFFPLEKENHLPKPLLSGPMLVLGGVPSSHRIIMVLVVGGIILSPRRQSILVVWAVCQLGDYMLPTTFYKNLKNPLIRELTYPLRRRFWRSFSFCHGRICYIII